MWAYFWCMFGCAGWILFFLIQAAYEDRVQECKNLRKQFELLALTTEERVG